MSSGSSVTKFVRKLLPPSLGGSPSEAVVYLYQTYTIL